MYLNYFITSENQRYSPKNQDYIITYNHIILISIIIYILLYLLYKYLFEHF